jgi:hypothetical protein
MRTTTEHVVLRRSHPIVVQRPTPDREMGWHGSHLPVNDGLPMPGTPTASVQRSRPRGNAYSRVPAGSGRSRRLSTMAQYLSGTVGHQPAKVLCSRQMLIAMIIPTMRPAAAVVIRWLVKGSMMSGRRGDQQQRDEGEGEGQHDLGR